MNVKASLTISGPPMPRALFTAQDMAVVALAAEAATVRRSFDQGRGLDDRPHRAYSTRWLKLYKRSSTGRAMAPKGGRPFAWVKGPKQRDGSYDEKRIGQEAGRIYEGGYRQFKRESRKGLVSSEGKSSAEVNLTLSGQLARSVRIIRRTATSATIGITGKARLYGGYVDDARPFMGLSPKDQDALRETIADLIDAHLGSGK